MPRSKRGSRMSVRGTIASFPRRTAAVAWLLAGVFGFAGCGHALPVVATFRGDATANIAADTTVRGALELKIPTAADPGEIMATIVRPGKSPAPCARVALIDVDGVLLNQN